MGFTFNGKHTDDFGLCFTTKSMPYIPSKRQKTEEIQGRDGQYIFEDGYDNIQIDLACTIAGYEIMERRKRAREISAWLANTGKLVFDYEKDIEYQVVKSVCDISANIVGREYRDEFSISFECLPYQKQSYYNDSLTWDETSAGWAYDKMPWNAEGYNRKFENIIPGLNVSIINDGTYKSLPTITVTGIASNLTFGSIRINDLNGTIYIDCDHKLVYSIDNGKKVNKMHTFSGDFITLLPGENKFQVNGSVTKLNLEFDYKNTYL